MKDMKKLSLNLKKERTPLDKGISNLITLS